MLPRTLLALALAALAGAAAAGEEGLGGGDFFWDLSLARRAGEPARTDGPLLELLPGTGGGRRLLVRLGARKAAVVLASGGRETELASAPLVKFPGKLTLVRRGRRHYLLADGALLLAAEHRGAHLGPPGFRARDKALSVKELLRQRTGPLRFSDGFSRPAGEPGPWKVRRGPWESAVHFYAERSANPGALRARFDPQLPEDPLTAGRVRSPRVGLGASFFPLEGGALAVMRVAGGSPAEKAGLGAGDVILEMNGRTPSKKGAMVLMAGRPAELSVLGSGRREPRKVRLLPESFSWGRSSRAAPLPGAGRAGTALALVGEPFWGLYRLECAARGRGGAAFGLAFAVRGNGEGLLFRLRPEGAGWRAELVRLGARGEVLGAPLAAEKIGSPWPDSWYRLAVDVSDDGGRGGFLVRCLLGDVEVLDARSPLAGFGRVGLWSAAGSGLAEFDDFAVAGDRTELRRREREPAAAGVYAHEPDMTGWALPGLDWVFREGGEARYRFACHSGALVRLEKLPEKEPVEITWSGGPGARSCGVRLDAAAGRAELFSGEETLRRAALPAAKGLLVRLASGRLSVEAGGKAFLSGAAGGANRPELSVRPARLVREGRVAVRSARGLELSFERAPVELAAVAGSWGLGTKWICDPRWSWFAGRARPLCAAWTCRWFEGSQSLDLFAAAMMLRDRPPHDLARDFGLTICGDGRSLWSGYTLVFGADNNRATRLYRRGRLVAESRKESARFPDECFARLPKTVLHQRWFRLTLERRGDRVTFSLDGRGALSWRDPQPLPGGRAAIWAVRGGLLAARLRADAQRVGRLEPDLGAPAPALASGPLAPAGSSGPAPKVAEASPGVWRVSSPVGGGPPAVRWRKPEFDPSAGGRLKFRFRAAPGTAVDLYLESEKARYRLGLTGPRPAARDGDRQSNWLGAAPGVRADGRWHELSLDLGACWRDFWRRRWPGRGALKGCKCRVVFGCLQEAGYAAAGLGANPPGAWYEISGLEHAAGGKDLAPPRVGRARLVGNSMEKRARLLVPISDPGGSGLNARRLTLLLGGRGLKVGSPGVSCSETAGLLEVDLGAVRARPGPAGEYRLALRGVADLAGNRIGDREVVVDFDAKADRRPPEAVSVTVRAGGRDCALDLDPGRFRLEGSALSGRLRRLYPERAAGPLGAELVSLIDGGRFSFTALPPAGSFDLARFPELDLVCRLGPDTPLAVVFKVGRRYAAAAINEAPVMRGDVRAWRPPKPLKADRSWERLTIPLAEAYWRSEAAAVGRPATPALRFGDAGYRGSRAGAHFSVGDLRLVPLLRPEEPLFAWSAWDAGGVADYRAAVDNSPDTNPRKRELESGKPLPEKVRAALKEGSAWLHLSFRDRAGNWSAPVHYRFIVDKSPPRLLRRDPPGASSPRADGFDLYLDDLSGINPAALWLSVNGREYRLGRGRGLSFDVESGRLRWDARAALGRPLRDGEKLAVRLACEDFPGNCEPLRFAWQVATAGDKKAPGTPRIRLEPPKGRTVMMGMVFRGGLSVRTVSAIRSARVELLEQGDEAAVRITQAGGGPMSCELTEWPWRLDCRGLLVFEYRAGPGSRLELWVNVSGHPLVVPLAGSPGSPLVADGAWHQAVIDLAAPARKKLGKLPLYCAHRLVLREPVGEFCRPGGFLELRRLGTWSGRTGGSRLVFEAADGESGLAGFSVALDREPGTIPPKRVTQPVSAAKAHGELPLGDLAPGAWWLHARAADLAGNWSSPTHYRLVVPKAAPARGETGRK